LSSWRKEWDIGDIFGTTMYRVVWNNLMGYFRYPLPASFYKFKANLQYAINSDLNQCYLWGVEWWYLQKLNSNSEYWDLAKTLFNK